MTSFADRLAGFTTSPERGVNTRLANATNATPALNGCPPPSIGGSQDSVEGSNSPQDISSASSVSNGSHLSLFSPGIPTIGVKQPHNMFMNLTGTTMNDNINSSCINPFYSNTFDLQSAKEFAEEHGRENNFPQEVIIDAVRFAQASD